MRTVSKIQRGLLLGGALLLLPGVILGLRRSPGDRGATGDASEETASNASQPGSVTASEAPARRDVLPATATAPDGSPAAEEPSLRCLLIDAATGKVLGGLTGIVHLHGGRNVASRRVESDRQGAFELRGLTPGKQTLEAQFPGYASSVRPVEIGNGPASEILEVILSKGLELAGEVVMPDGSPIENATVRLALVDGAGPEGASASTDASGRFTVSGLRAGSYRITAYREGWQRGFAEATLPSPSSARIVLQEDMGLVVIVTDGDGQPVPGARVALKQRSNGIRGGIRSGITSRLGVLRLSGLAEETGADPVVEASREGHVTWRGPVTSEARGSGRLEIRLDPACELSGRVADATGVPVADAEVRLTKDGKQIQGTLRTASTGGFRFKSLAAGKYSLGATSSERGSGALVDIGVEPGSTREVELALETGQGTITGRVTDDRGAGVPLCPIALRRAGLDEGAPAIRVTSDRDGRFRFAGLPDAGLEAGWHLTAGGGKLETAVLDVSAAQASRKVEIVIRKLGSIRGFVALEPGCASYSVVLARTEEGGSTAASRTFRFSSSDGWFHLKGIEPGAYRITAVVAGREAASAENVEVRPGETTGAVELVAG